MRLGSAAVALHKIRSIANLTKAVLGNKAATDLIRAERRATANSSRSAAGPMSRRTQRPSGSILQNFGKPSGAVREPVHFHAKLLKDRDVQI